MRAYQGCDIGRVRSENQDSVRASDFPDGVLAFVCDGMGGMQNGLAAGKIAIAAAEERFCMEYLAGMPAEEICELLRSCAAEANQKVYQAAIHSAVPSRMGTTLVGAFACDDVCCLVNVGDSRAYLIGAEGEAKQLTTDHTVVQMLYERGAITAEERATHERRNELVRAIGVSTKVLADTQMIPLRAGERILLCSDGLYGMVSAAEIAELVRSNPPKQVPARCIEAANAAGGQDNISVILLTAE